MKDRFMIGLSTKLQECMVLNTRGTFPEFVSNVMIMGDAIRAHKETKKRKVVSAPSVVLLQTTGWCITMTPLTQPNHHSSTSTSVSRSSGLLSHLNTHTSGQHLRLYLHLHL
jgi:hypothetical protein